MGKYFLLFFISITAIASAVRFVDIGVGQFTQTTTPSNPASGKNRIYFKSDDKLYKLDSSGNELEIGAGGGGSADAVTRDIAQTGHGFAVGEVIYFDGSNWDEAKADADATSESIGMVSAVADANNFTVTFSGYVSGLSGLTSGATYYLSDATAGLATTTEPTTCSHVSKPVGVALSTTTIRLFDSSRGIILCGGSIITSSVHLQGAGGTQYGTTNDKIPRFSTTLQNTGSDITYTDSSPNGASFTINASGGYCVSFHATFTAGADFGVSLNSAQLTTSITTITTTDVMAMGTTGGNQIGDSVSFCRDFVAGDVIRPHTDGTAFVTLNRKITFSIYRVK